MKTMILYESKKGCTKKCAEYVHERKPSSEIHTTKDVQQLPTDIDQMILFSPIYIGQLHKRMKQFIQNNEEMLLQKPLTIILCGMNEEGFDETMKRVFSEEIQNHADIHLVGGAYYFDKLNFLERMIVKKIANVQSTVENIDFESLERIALQ